MSTGLEKLKAGECNSVVMENQPDGSLIVTVSRRGEGKRYRFQVKDLYGPDEEVLLEEVIPDEQGTG